jgi:peptidyl-prolyl cis-trans isomerase A (cyclophilin A)
MGIRSFSVAVILCAASLSAHAQPRPASRPVSRAGIIPIIIETSRGSISAELDSARAPATVVNFLRYIDGGFFTNGRFYRAMTPANQPNDSVRIGVIQGGPDPLRAASGFAPIQLESTAKTGLRHHDGTLSMARAGPNTATSDFFICIGDQPGLDFGGHRNLDGQGFAAFGRVTNGMAVVRAIQHAAAQGEQLVPPVTILRVRRAGSSRAAQSAAPPPSSRGAAPAAVREIPTTELPAVSAKVKTLRVVPGTLTLRVGQTVSLDSLTVVAVDGLGHDLGRLRAFDFGIKPGAAASVVPRQVTGNRAGAADLTVRYPRSAWGTRMDIRPSTVVHVVVKP